MATRGTSRAKPYVIEAPLASDQIANIDEMFDILFQDLFLETTGTLPATLGGTGLTSFAVGDLLYADTTTTLAKLADVAVGSMLISGGVGVAPSWSANPLITSVVFEAATTSGIRLDLESGVLAVREGDDSAYATAVVGNLGVGTNAPDQLIHVKNASDAARIRIESGGGSNASLLFSQTGAQKWTIFSVGGTDRMEIQSSVAAGSDWVLKNGASAALNLWVSPTGNFGVGVNTTTAPAGTFGLVFADGTAMSSMIANTAGLYADDVSGTVRMFGIDEAGVTGALTMASGSLTSGRVALITTNGLLSDDADLTFATDTLTATKILAPTSVSTPSLISTGALGITPASGSNLNVTLATTGDFAVNTSQLYVDTSTARVGISTATPSGILHLNQVTGAVDVYMTSGDNSGTLLRLQRNAAASYFFIDTRSGQMSFDPPSGSGFVLDASNSLAIGTTVFPSTGSMSLVFGDGTAPSGMGTNTAGLYANDVAGTVEMFAIDEAGASSQISPHGFVLFQPDDAEPYPWSYYSTNAYLGEEINVDMAGVIRAVEQLTGKTFIYRRRLPPEQIRDWDVDQLANMTQAAQKVEEWGKQQDPTISKPPDPVYKEPPLWMQRRGVAPRL